MHTAAPDKCGGELGNNSPGAENAAAQCVQERGLWGARLMEHNSICKVGWINYPGQTWGQPGLKFCGML